MERIEGADALVMLPFVDVPRERCEDGVDVVADLAVTVDELGVVVAEDGAAGCDGEKEGAAADERLVISADARGDVAEQLGEERGLAADPFEERCRPDAVLGKRGAQS